MPSPVFGEFIGTMVLIVLGAGTMLYTLTGVVHYAVVGELTRRVWRRRMDRRIERMSGEFQRRFSLPETADAQNIKAKVTNGVLEVAIPKLAQVQPHKIMVEAA